MAFEAAQPKIGDSTPPSSGPVPLGAIINGKYRVEGVIAEGGMGVVYSGWHAALERRVAIKVMRQELNDNTEAVRRFLNEARMLARLRGIHQAQVLDIGRIQNGPAYMVLEYLEGGDLRALLEREGPLPIGRAVELMLQACDAVGEAHAAGIIHRDLKPENFLLTESLGAVNREVLKLIDFGISKRLDAPPQRHLTMDGESLGSPHYMSPEQMSSPKTTDARSDIWSLGVVLFELLTNRMPFEGETVAVVFAQVLGGNPRRLSEYLPDVPPALEAIVDRCLRLNREERFGSTAELRAALAPFASSEWPRAYRISLTSGSFGAPFQESRDTERNTPAPRVHMTTFSAISKPRRRNRALGMAAAAALGLAATGYTYSDTLRESATPTFRVAQGAASEAFASTAHNVRDLAHRAQAALEAREAADAPEPATTETPIIDPSCERRDGAGATAERASTCAELRRTDAVHVSEEK